MIQPAREAALTDLFCNDKSISYDWEMPVKMQAFLLVQPHK